MFDSIITPYGEFTVVIAGHVPTLAERAAKAERARKRAESEAKYAILEKAFNACKHKFDLIEAMRKILGSSAPNRQHIEAAREQIEAWLNEHAPGRHTVYMTEVGIMDEDVAFEFRMRWM